MDKQSPVYELAPLDQLTPRGWIRQIFAFPTPNPGVDKVFRDGLAGLLEDIPYLRSDVVQTGNPAAPTALSEPRWTLDDIFSAVDLSDSIDYAVLRAADFSPKILSRKDIEPIGPASPIPVFRIKLTLVNGGCLLYLALTHAGHDITACGTLLKIWASYCRTGSSASVGFSPVWLDRTPLRTLTGPAAQPPPERIAVQKPSEAAQSQAERREEVFETAVFRFSGKSLADLKSQVNARAPQLDVPWVSTSDVLIALIWSAITSAEEQIPAPRAGSEPTKPPKKAITVLMPVNFRQRLNPPLPKEYLGAAYSTVAATVQRDDLLSVSQTGNIESLAAIAAAIRASYGTVTHDSVKNISALVQACPDVSKVSWAPPGDGIAIISWADQGVHELDWGAVIGRCEATRFQQFGYRSYPWIMPRLPNGDYEYIVSLEEHAMQLFRAGFVMSKIASGH